MKVTQQSPVLPTRTAAPAEPVVTPEEIVGAAPILQSQEPASAPRHSDIFGDAPSVMVGAQENSEPVVSSDPVSRADNAVAEKFFKAMAPTIHVVEKGDTLKKIARDHYPASYANEDFAITNIASLNGIEDPNLIKVGQELRIPGVYTYTVQPGDTLGKIARFSDNALSDIVAINGIKDPNVIRVGQELVLEGPYGDAFSAVADRLWNGSQSVTHTVKPGDTLTKLAREYFPEAEFLQHLVDRFASENELEDPNLIRVGQELKVPGLFTYEVQEGDSAWSLNFPLNGGLDNSLLDANGKPLQGEPVPGTEVRFFLFEH